MSRAAKKSLFASPHPPCAPGSELPADKRGGQQRTEERQGRAKANECRRTKDHRGPPEDKGSGVRTTEGGKDRKATGRCRGTMESRRWIAEEGRGRRTDDRQTATGGQGAAKGRRGPPEDKERADGPEWRRPDGPVTSRRPESVGAFGPPRGEDFPKKKTARRRRPPGEENRAAPLAGRRI